MGNPMNTRTDWRPGPAIRGPHQAECDTRRLIVPDHQESRARLLVRPVGDLIVVRCFSTQVEWDDPETGDLGTSLLGLSKLGYVRILVNLEGINYASGSLLGSLAHLHQATVRAGGFLKLFGLEAILRDALVICRLDSRLAIYASESEALEGSVPAADHAGLWIPGGLSPRF